MSQNVSFRRFRPHLFTRFHALQRTVPRRTFTCTITQHSNRDVTNDYKKRVAQLEAYKTSDEWYPRLESGHDARWPIQKYRKELDFLENDDTLDDGDTFTIAGMAGAAGKKGSWTNAR